MFSRRFDLLFLPFRLAFRTYIVAINKLQSGVLRASEENLTTNSFYLWFFLFRYLVQ